MTEVEISESCCYQRKLPIVDLLTHRQILGFVFILECKKIQD